MSHTPTVFVSSTFYDLKQIRRDLREFIDSYGFEPLLSEYDSFPVSPNVGTVENCLRAVESRADIFVLVVGGRRGSIDKATDKSITNLELIKAKEKKIPIYIFVDRTVLDVMKVWQKNPDSDFSLAVDSSVLFEFISSLQNTGANWVYNFEHAQDIIEALRRQWSYLFYEGLEHRRKLAKSLIPQSLQGLDPESLRIAIDQPRAWEYRLFASILRSELTTRSALRRDMALGLDISPVRILDHHESVAWIQDQLESLRRIVSAMEPVAAALSKEAFGEPGKPGDSEAIAYLAMKIGAIYEAAIQWTLRHNHVRVDDRLRHLVELQQGFAKPWIRNAETIAENLSQQIDSALASIDHHDGALEEPVVLEIDFSWHDPTTPEYHQEMKRLQSE